MWPFTILLILKEVHHIKFRFCCWFLNVVFDWVHFRKLGVGDLRDIKSHSLVGHLTQELEVDQMSIPLASISPPCHVIPLSPQLMLVFEEVYVIFKTNVNTEDVFFELNSGTKTSLFQSLIAIMNPQKKRDYIYTWEMRCHSSSFPPRRRTDGSRCCWLVRVIGFYYLPIIPDFPSYSTRNKLSLINMTLLKILIFLSSYRMIMYLKWGIFSAPNGQIQIAPLVRLLNL